MDILQFAGCPGFFQSLVVECQGACLVPRLPGRKRLSQAIGGWFYGRLVGWTRVNKGLGSPGREGEIPPGDRNR